MKGEIEIIFISALILGIFLIIGVRVISFGTDSVRSLVQSTHIQTANTVISQACEQESFKTISFNKVTPNTYLLQLYVGSNERSIKVFNDARVKKNIPELENCAGSNCLCTVTVKECHIDRNEIYDCLQSSGRCVSSPKKCTNRNEKITQGKTTCEGSSPFCCSKNGLNALRQVHGNYLKTKDSEEGPEYNKLLFQIKQINDFSSKINETYDGFNYGNEFVYEFDLSAINRKYKTISYDLNQIILNVETNQLNVLNLENSAKIFLSNLECSNRIYFIKCKPIKCILKNEDGKPILYFPYDNQIKGDINLVFKEQNYTQKNLKGDIIFNSILQGFKRGEEIKDE